MILKLLQTDFMKIKRKGFWFLAFLGAFGVIFLQMINYGFRKEWLLQQSDNDWLYYLGNVSNFTPLALVLGITILTSLMASIENETNAWKQLIALPVSKMSVYLSKFTLLGILLFVASILLFIFTLTFGIILDLGADIPYVELATYSFYPYFACIPILALHLWVATVSKNQGIPITLGVFGFLVTPYGYYLPDWLIYKWPSLYNGWDDPLINVGLGIGVGFIVYLIGLFDFVRRDVK